MSALDVVSFAVAVSAVPAFAMLVGSWVLLKAQNLSGGLILAAVASELFPLLAEAQGPAAVGGLTLGFFLGLCVVFGTEQLGEWLEGGEEEDEDTKKHDDARLEDAARSVELLSLEHRNHIRSHLDELADAISTVDRRASTLLLPQLPVEEEEEVSEAIDEEIHRLHYKLDHTRRLLEGSESGSTRARFGFDRTVLPERITELKESIAHLQEHFGAPSFDHPTVLEVHHHMDELEALLHKFHTTVQTGFSYWRRRGPVAEPKDGAYLPKGLVCAVLMDSFIDGFLVGISCCFSRHAGLVLAAANVLEMGFVGASFAATVSKCTGSSPRMRWFVVTLMPLTLLGASAIGAAMGGVSRENPPVFVGFVAFGVVALLFLVTHELLIEAHEALKTENIVWINLIFYLGIYVVLLFNRFLPGH